MSMATRVRDAYKRTREFLEHQIWEQRLDTLPASRARWFQAARIAYATLRGLVIGDTLHVRAAALTYFTVLSLVPLLAFAFALLKGFGAYELLIERTIRPQLMQFFSRNQALSDAFDQILRFVDSTGVTSLGFVGLLTLLYAATRLLRNVEAALNELWGVASSRRPLEQLRDYISIIVITPLCLVGAAGLTTAGQAITLLRSAGETLGIASVLNTLISVAGPLTVLFIGLLVLYKVLPYTNVRMVSAAVGAAVGAVLWYAVLIAHVRFQVGVARFNALYSSFAAVPIFLAWLQISWLVVLVGAQVAATHQNSRTLARQRRTRIRDRVSEEQLGLSATLHIAETFVNDVEPPTLQQLAAELDDTEAQLAEILSRLVAARILAKTFHGKEPAFVLAKPAARIHIKDVLDALRSQPGQHNQSSLQRAGTGPYVRRARELWEDLDRAATRLDQNRSLAEVLQPEPRYEPADGPTEK